MYYIYGLSWQTNKSSDYVHRPAQPEQDTNYQGYHLAYEVKKLMYAQKIYLIFNCFFYFEVDIRARAVSLFISVI